MNLATLGEIPKEVVGVNLDLFKTPRSTSGRKFKFRVRATLTEGLTVEWLPNPCDPSYDYASSPTRRPCSSPDQEEPNLNQYRNADRTLGEHVLPKRHAPGQKKFGVVDARG